MNRSPSTVRPSPSVSDATSPLAPKRHVHDAALGPLDAQLLRERAQPGREAGGIELVGVAEGGQQRVRIGIRRLELRGARRHDGQRIALDRPRLVRHPPPVMVEADIVHVTPERAERVDIAIALAAPIAELDAELEGGLGRGHELGLIQPQPLDEGADVRQRRLAHAHDADLFGFDQVHACVGGQQLRDRGRRHPAGRAAADDHHPQCFGLVQRVSSRPDCYRSHTLPDLSSS